VVESVFSFDGDNYGTSAARYFDFDTEADLKHNPQIMNVTLFIS